jgi:hypothetical protein
MNLFPDPGSGKFFDEFSSLCSESLFCYLNETGLLLVLASETARRKEKGRFNFASFFLCRIQDPGSGIKD